MYSFANINLLYKIDTCRCNITAVISDYVISDGFYDL